MKRLALPATSPDAADCSGAMASAIVDLALELQRTASFALPGKKVATLRDAAFHLRRAGAPGALLKKLGLLNSAASLIRHFDLAWASSLRLELAEALPTVSVLPMELETASSRDGDDSSARSSLRAEKDSGASSDLEASTEAAPAGALAASGPDDAAGASVAKLIERFEPLRTTVPAHGPPEHPRHQPGDQHEVPPAGQQLAAPPLQQDDHPLHDALPLPDGGPDAAPLRDHDPPAAPLADPRASTPPPLGSAARLRGAPWADDETDKTEDGHNNDDDDALDRVATAAELPAPAAPSPPVRAGKPTRKRRPRGREPRPPTDVVPPGSLLGAAAASAEAERLMPGWRVQAAAAMSAEAERLMPGWCIDCIGKPGLVTREAVQRHVVSPRMASTGQPHVAEALANIGSIIDSIDADLPLSTIELVDIFVRISRFMDPLVSPTPSSCS